MSNKRSRRNRQKGASNEAQRERAFERAVPAPAPEAQPAEVIDAALAIVERAKGDVSQQPRFSNDEVTASNVFRSVWNWVRVGALSDEPASNATMRQWDAWLRKFVLLEPYLAGVLNSVVQIDKNRGWELIGGRNQVARYVSILHDADEGAGWRSYVSWQAQSYYNARAGFVTEVGSDGEGGPLRALWSVDPARIELTANSDYPLRYFPTNGTPQLWTAWDYFRGCSLVSTDEMERGYGYPANARNLDLARIMCAVWEHDKEQLGARAPRGLLLLSGISQDQWETAMESREEMLNGKERQYYGGVAVLASSGLEDIKATLFALSQLPKDFNLLEWVNLLMYGYSLNFGYDAREFFPVNSGQLGSSKETEIQHRKASSKGEYDFALVHAEQLQNRLPDSLQFQYEQRDANGEKLDAELAMVKAQLITEMANWRINNASVLTPEQVLQLAAEQGVIPEEWTIQEEEASATDTEQLEVQEERVARARALELPRVQRAMSNYPDEPIVRYNSRTGRMKTLLDPMRVTRQYSIQRVTVNGIVTAFKRDLKQMVRSYCRGGSTPTLLVGDLRDVVSSAVADAFYAGLASGGISATDAGVDESQRADDLVLDQLEHVEKFADAVADACGDRDAVAAINARVELWARSVQAAGEAGVNMALANEMVEFGGEDGDEICPTCERLKGQRHRRKWFEEHGLVPGQPGNENFECGGYRCQHKLIPTRRRTTREIPLQRDPLMAGNASYTMREQQPVRVTVEPAQVQITQAPMSAELEQAIVTIARAVGGQAEGNANLIAFANHVLEQGNRTAEAIVRQGEQPINVVVNVPQQPPPVINVAPEVTNVIEVPPTPEPVVNVTLELPPTVRETIDIVRDSSGKVSKMIVEKE